MLKHFLNKAIFVKQIEIYLSMTKNTTQTTPNFEINCSRQFINWMLEQQVSLTFSTYQVGKVFMLGVNPENKLAVVERTFDRCMGLATTKNGFWMSGLYQMFKFENTLPSGSNYQGYDRMYVPQKSYFTGDLDIHDIIIEEDKPVFVNTLFSCLATVSDTHSFKPVWQPPFISKLAAEDRCHLNGLGERDGKAAYVTAVSKSDVADGWRDRRANGGIVMNVQTNEIICEGLSMPHSPRWHNNKLWILEAGSGYFGYVDEATQKFERVAFCPGFLRGMDFIGNYAVVGTSMNRKNKTFQGLELDDNLKKFDSDPRCGLHIIDLTTGDIVNWVRLGGIIDELFDVKTLSNVKRPMVIGTKSPEIRRLISIEK